MLLLFLLPLLSHQPLLYLFFSCSLSLIQVNFDWGNGLVTPDGSSFVSVRWLGKLLPPVSETFTFYLTADDAANLALNHTLLINASDVCCIEHRATVFLTQGVYYDLALEYQQLTGAANVVLQYSSASVRKQVGGVTQLHSTSPHR